MATDMSLRKPAVTVIMPCFNHGHFLIESAQSVLAQTYSDLELIIVDDCSTDTTWETICTIAAGDGRVKPIRHEQNKGLTQSRNDALAVAQGAFISFCDSDDIWEANKLSVQMALLDARPEYGAVYSDSLIIDENGRSTGQRFSNLFPLPQQTSGWLFPELVLRNFINIQSVLMRRACFEIVGPFDDRLEWIQDWWYWLQLSKTHQWLYCEEPLARYRIHSGSTNLVHRRTYAVNRWKAFRRILLHDSALPTATKAEINYEMGVDLSRLGKRRWSRRFFWTALKLSTSHSKGAGRFCKSFARLAMSASPLFPRGARA